ncbi:MAG: TIGR00341 family protein [Rhodoferax sp.]|nr:TIGR00341 family protein [Rhodoferax sp.]
MNLDSLKRRFHSRFDLQPDQADASEIDQTFRSGVEFRGTNLWVLIFAIFIASIGLNVNSTAVIIGAMLISPLMGPIMALGYGAGINDSALMRSSVFNLGLAAILSLLASTAYFLITPLSQAHSELLARTTPSIWDVLIALFGGLAGVIGATRRVKSNLIPGVAIATALMPPLCTAGYGLAVGNFQYFFGAFYLFAINCVFIAIATLMIVRLMHLPSVKLLEEHAAVKRRTIIGLVVLLTVVPSLYLAFDLVQKELFDVNSTRYIHEVVRANPNVLVLSQGSDYQSRQIRVTLAGERLSDTTIKAMEKRISEYGLRDAQLVLAQSGQVMPDINAVKKDILKDFIKSNQTEVIEREARIAALQKELGELRKAASTQLPLHDIYREITAQFPQALQISVTSGYRAGEAPIGAPGNPLVERPLLLVQLKLTQPLSATERQRLRLGLGVRAGLNNADDVELDVTVSSAAVRKTKAAKR